MIVLITGANKGIGKEIAKQLVNKGAIVLLGARNLELGTLAAKEINATFVQLDVTDQNSINKAVGYIEKQYGRLDVLINNAGISVEMNSASTATLEAMKTTFETNFFGVVAVTNSFLPLLRKSSEKKIINVSTELGSTTLHNVPEWKYYKVGPLGYCSSKAALNSYTVLLAKELREEGFKINAVNPGYVGTDLNHHTGPGTVEDGARITVQTALSNGEQTSAFLTWGGTLAW